MDDIAAYLGKSKETRAHNSNNLIDSTVHSLTTHLGQAPKTMSFLRGDPRGIQARQLWETIHSEARVAGRKSEGVSFQHQRPEAGERAQGIQQGLLVLKLTVTQVQTHQLWPEVRDSHCFYRTAVCCAARLTNI